MTVIKILGSLLIAGILGSANGEFNIPDGLFSMGAGFEGLPDEGIKKLCNDNGGPEALEKFIGGTIYTVNCFKKITDKTAQEAIQRGPTSRPLDLLLDALCTEVPTAKSCIRSHTNALKVCQKPEEHHKLDIVNKVFGRTIDFICSNTDKISEATTSPSTEMCFESKYRTLIECAENILNSEGASKFQPDFALSLAMLLSTDEQGCRNLGTMQTCIVKALNGCEDKMGAELLDSLFKSVNNEVPCANLEKSHASSASVVNFALLVVAVAMSL